MFLFVALLLIGYFFDCTVTLPETESLENESEEKSTMNWEMKLIAIDEKWNRRLAQQSSLLYEQIEQLQTSMTKLSQAITLDWSYENDGLRYKKFDNLKSWDDAEKVCGLFDGELAVVDSEAKNRDMIKLIGRSSNSDFWIGLKTEMQHETAVNYTNFDETQEMHGCASIDSVGRWRMKPCDQRRGFICQLDSPFQ
ncbi:hypothetical protein M3Y95_00567400 [Aphelenchoides besseyi]|nr:hypothetical protein M3Y95_00567400 [Aphelenchoides besseyi]